MHGDGARREPPRPGERRPHARHVAVNSLTIPWIAIPLFIQTILIFAVTYLLAKVLGFTYEYATPSAMIGGVEPL